MPGLGTDPSATFVAPQHLATAISVLLALAGGAGGIGGAISLLVKSWEGLGKLSMTSA